MSYDDWSSRKLRKKYLGAIKEVWRLQRAGFNLMARNTLKTEVSDYAEELQRRGWMV